MRKVVIITETNVVDFEEKIEKLINGNDIWHDDFKKLVSIDYSYNRASGYYEDIVYSALVIYDTE